ncbi:MAG: acylneuraminate cytidylyltransferase family protein [Nitrospirae bacterium YQR-1]
MSSKVVAIIPARGGSKGLPRKHLLNLGNKPLIAWTVEDAKNCPLVERVVVSTDCEHIREASIKYGADVPFLRPPVLAEDMSPAEDVLIHALNWFITAEKVTYDIVLYLQATDPFRNSTIINDCVKALIADETLDTVFAAYPEHKNYWKKVDGRYVRLDERGHTPRQIKEHVYREDTGVACATRTAVIMSGKRIGENVKIIPHHTLGSFVDIHTELDLFIANTIWERFLSEEKYSYKEMQNV